jgi:hypothetical protein
MEIGQKCCMLAGGGLVSIQSFVLNGTNKKTQFYGNYTACNKINALSFFRFINGKVSTIQQKKKRLSLIKHHQN